MLRRAIRIKVEDYIANLQLFFPRCGKDLVGESVIFNGIKKPLFRGVWGRP
jgi:hypothetical protein